MRFLPALLAAPLLAQAVPPAFYPGKAYRAGVPLPVLGSAYTPHSEAMAYLRRLAEAAPDRVRLLPYHTTEEGRSLLLVVLSSPRNLRGLEALKAANARLADPPAGASPAEPVPGGQPAFLWLGYSVHGSEAAGSEAALAVAYHFAACQDPGTLRQLEAAVVLLDVVQNPDGRDRHFQAVAEALQGENPPDPQDAQNQGRWPGGRFNHRLFDLNRDWAWQTQGETRAKVRQFLAWNPQVLVDLHEMGPERSCFFPPNAPPVHKALSGPFGGAWQAAFGGALARTFDENGFAYATRELFDLFYPSYGDSWASLQGAAGMTFECPSPGGLAYLRKDGQVLRLAGRIQRHFAASLSIVALAADKRRQLLEDYQRVRAERRKAGARAGAFLLGAGADGGRALALARLLQANGLEVLRTLEPAATASWSPIAAGTLPATAPAGSYLVPLDQPRAPLAVALLEKEAATGPKASYDATAWSLPLAWNVPAWFAAVRPTVPVEALTEAPAAAPARARYAYLLPAGTQGRERVLEALLKEGFRASASAAPFRLQGRLFPAGTVIFPRGGNDSSRLDARVAELCAAPGAGACVVAADSGRAEEGPDLGAGRNLPLRPPRVAVIMDAPSSPTAVGAVMHTLLESGIPFTQLRASGLAKADLRNYTHVILADDGALGKAYQSWLGASGAERLKAYLQEGGVLLALQGGAAFASRSGLCAAGCAFPARGMEEARLREKDPRREEVPAPLEARTGSWAEREERELRDAAPGTFLRGQVDATHPLTWGLEGGEAPIQDHSDVILELSPRGENPIRYGTGELRVSGFLGKDLEPRLRNTAYLLREPRGRGAVILFAGDPVHRGMAPFTTRAFMNALFFGAYPGGSQPE